MRLHALRLPGREPERPWLVWLHGLLGSHTEWQTMAAQFSAWPQLLVDLPGHGQSPLGDAPDFAAFTTRLESTLRAEGIRNYWLIGYSLGGRLAMYHACRGAHLPCGLVVEGGNPGLSDEPQRAERRRHDARWAGRFDREPMAAVLDDWYQQPVFAHLNAAERQALVTLRAGADGSRLAQMLMATSLGNQPDLRAELARLSIPFYAFFGERDAKFSALARALPAHPVSIPAAGHNAHRENPAAFADRLLQILHLPLEEQS